MKDQVEGVVEPTTAVAPTSPVATDDALPSGRSTDDGAGSDGGGRGARRSRKGAKRPFKSLALEWGLLILGAVVIAIVIKAFLFQAFYIPSESMVPTLQKGDRVLVNKLSYHLHDVHRGDIVVFTAPPGTKTEEIKDLVKRVVGLPGEKIEGRGGQIFINDRLLQEPYLPKETRSRTFGPETVPASSYFVLGDNRAESKDSTYFGPIKRSTIVGRVFLRILPLGRIGFL